MGIRWRNIDWDAYILLAPVLLLFGIGVLYPLIDTVRFSTVRWNGLGPIVPVGLENYRRLFSDPNFINSLRITVVFTIASTGLSVFLGWAIAILSGLIPGRSTVYRLAIFAAYSISAVASGIMWHGIFHPNIGLLNGVLEAVGLEAWARAWLGNPDIAIWSVIVAYVWTQVGLPLLVCFAAVQSIPNSLFEAARIDGAGSWELMRYIMVPLSRPGVRVAVFINLLNSLKAFDLIYVLTRGGPLRSTETIGYFMYNESVSLFKLGYGAASVVVLSIVVFLLAIPLIKERSGHA